MAGQDNNDSRNWCDDLHDQVLLFKLNNNIALNTRFTENFGLFNTTSTIGMPQDLFVEFANKHQFQNTVLALHDYLVHARNNKLCSGWSKLLIDVMNNNFQSDLASELKPTLEDKTSYEVFTERENLRRMGISSSTSNRANENENFEISTNVAILASLSQEEFQSKCKEMFQKEKLEYHSVYRKMIANRINQHFLPTGKAEIFCDEAVKVAVNSSKENAAQNIEAMRILTLIEGNEILKSKIKNDLVDYELFPKSNEELDTISQFLAIFDIKTSYIDITLPTNVQDMKLLGFTKSIGKSSHVITHLHIRNIESNNNDVISKEITKSVRNIIFLYFVNEFTPEQFQNLKIRLREYMENSKITSPSIFVITNERRHLMRKYFCRSGTRHYVIPDIGYPPWNLVDIRNLKSNEIKNLVEKVSKLNNVIIRISSKQEIVHLDKLVSSLDKQKLFNDLHIFLEDETVEEFALHLLFVALTREHFKVSYLFLYNVKFNESFYEGMQKITEKVTNTICIYTEDNFTNEEKEVIINKYKKINRNNTKHLKINFKGVWKTVW